MKRIRDGWDLGILIRMNRWEELPLTRISSELISEVGWLDGGEEELKKRLKRLEKHGFIEENEEKTRKYSSISNGELFYRITEKGKKLFEVTKRRFRVYENQFLLLRELDDKEKAITFMRKAHIVSPEKYHELFELIKGQYIGIRQYKPFDRVK